MKVTWKGGWFG
jgi:hypothetical protein